MRSVWLFMDSALVAQRALLDRGNAAGALTIDARHLGPRLRLWARERHFERLRRKLEWQLPARDGPALVFAGSGDFHHVSAMLIARATEIAAAPLTVVHVDNHPDWVRFAGGVHCGSWVGRAARLAGVARLITLGVCSADVRQPWRKGADLALVAGGQVELYTWSAPRHADHHTISGVTRPTMLALGEDGFLAHLLRRIATRNVYLTIDKDALAAVDAATNWDQGQMRLAYLERLIAALGERHRIVGADVVGDWSEPVYGGKLLERLRKRIEAALDQPRRQPDPATATAINQSVNLSLLDSLSRVMA